METEFRVDARKSKSAVVSAAHLTFTSWRESLERRSIGPNISAGITVALVALPLNLALAIACGLPPSLGLVSGAVAGILGALLGGSKLQVTGPEVALAPITLEIVSRHGLEGLLAATFLAGLIQIGFGILRVGHFVHAIPLPVIGGFLAAVGLLVFDSQLPRLMGLPAELTLLSQAGDLGVLGQIDPMVFFLGCLVCAVVIALPRIAPRMPAPLVGLGVAVLAVALLGVSAPTVAAVEVGSLRPRIPTILGANLDLAALLPEALALAMLASIDSLLCALAVGSRVEGDTLRSNQELIAQGFANIGSACFGGMPVAAAVVRSMAAVEAGATTRLAPIVQSIVLLLILLVLAPFVSFVPLLALAGILTVIGYRLINWRQLAQMWRIAPFEALVFIVTAAGILLTDFVGGVAIGVIASLLHFAHQQRAALLSARNADTVESNEEPVQYLPTGGELGIVATSEPRGGIQVIKLCGPLFFGSQDRVDVVLQQSIGQGGVLVDMTSVSSVDVSGAMALASKLKRLTDTGTRIWISAATDGSSGVLKWALTQAGAHEICVLDGLGVLEGMHEETPPVRSTPRPAGRALLQHAAIGMVSTIFQTKRS